MECEGLQSCSICIPELAMCGLTSGPTAIFSIYIHGPGSKSAPLSAKAITDTAPFLPWKAAKNYLSSRALLYPSQMFYHVGRDTLSNQQLSKRMSRRVEGLRHLDCLANVGLPKQLLRFNCYKSSCRESKATWDIRVVPSRGSTAISIWGDDPLPMRSPLQSCNHRG